MKSNNIILFVIFLFSICTKSFGKITFIEKGFTFETLKGDSLVRIKSFKSDTIVEELHIPATITHNREKYKVYILGRESLANHSEILSVMVDEGVSVIGDNAFENCINLKSLYLPASISSVGICLFGSCYNLRSIVIDSNNEDYDSREGCNAIINSNTNELVAGCVATVIPSSVKSIASFAFYHCNTMKELTIPEGVESIGDFSFGSCTSLKNIILPLSLKKIGWNAFNACTSLKKIFIPRNVSFIGKRNIFSYCRELTSIVVDKNNAYYDSRSNCNAIIQKSGAKLIAACRTTVIPEDVRELGEECCYATFMHKVKIPKSVENIDGSAFNDCFELDSIIVMKGNSSYTSPTGSNAVLTKDGQTLVVGCRTSIIPKGVKKIGHSAFFGKYVQPFLELPDGVEKIEDSAFQNCQGLSSVIIPASIKEIGSMAFAQCSNLSTVNFLSTPELIERWTFKDCHNLSVVNLSQGLKSIQNWSFQGCVNLKQIYIPSTVTNIEKDAFKNCPVTLIKR